MVKTHPPVQSCKESIERTLDQLLTPPEGPFSYVFHAARYSLLSPGKRLRPLLVIASGEAFGASIEKTLIPACALEMIHTYSLIHDDLPSMDNDDLRRGKPTLHKVYPEGQAILAGDLLLTRSFETLASSPNLTPQQIVDMIGVLSMQAGGMGMIGGQSLDPYRKNFCFAQRLLRNWRHRSGSLGFHSKATLFTWANHRPFVSDHRRCFRY
jgi:geranylgeranyl diphosphate synthase type II